MHRPSASARAAPKHSQLASASACRTAANAGGRWSAMYGYNGFQGLLRLVCAAHRKF